MDTVRCWLLAMLMIGAWSGEAPPGRDLGDVVARLVEAQAEMQHAAAVATATVPSGMNDMLIVRRTIAADWLRRLEAGAVREDDPALRRFIDETTGLVQGLRQLADLIRQSGEAPRRYPHSLTEPALARYRALVHEAFDQGLQAVIAGRQRDPAVVRAWNLRQQRHLVLLQVIEAGNRADRRYTMLPRDDRWLVEYREHLLLLRTMLEQSLETGGTPDVSHLQEVLAAYAYLLDRRMALHQDITDSGLPADAPEVAVLTRVVAREIAVLEWQVALARARSGDDGDAEYWQQREALERQHARCERLTGLAEDWLSAARQRIQQEHEIVEYEPDADPLVIRALRAALATATTEQRAALDTFAKAIETDDQLAALAARHALQRAELLDQRRRAHLEEEALVPERERAWQAQAGDPAIAEKLREWHTRRATVLAARRAADEAGDAALAAEQAAEVADWVSREARERARVAESAAETHDLFELGDALDEMVELRAGAVQAQ